MVTYYKSLRIGKDRKPGWRIVDNSSNYTYNLENMKEYEITEKFNKIEIVDRNN